MDLSRYGRKKSTIASDKGQVTEDRPFKQRVLICALIGAVLFAVTLIALQAPVHTPPLPRWNAIGIDLDPTPTVGSMILLGPLLSAWIFSVRLRCSDAAIRRYLTAIVVLLIAWLGVVLVKYSSTGNNLLISILWYLFYIPMVFVPTLCLFSALRAAALNRKPSIRRLKRIIVAIDCLLVALVLTNNVHHFAFVFDFNDPAWGSTYTYAWGYWAVFSWIAFLFTTFLGVLFVAAHRPLRNVFAPVLVIACMGFSYALLYALRIIGMQTNLTLTFSVVVFIGLELCLSLGLLPSCIWYTDAFRKLPFDLKILTLDNQVKFSTNPANSLTPTSKTAPNHPPPAQKSHEGVLISKTYKITGGSVLLLKDISSIIERRTQLEMQQSVLRRRNLMLEQNRAIRGRLYRQKAEHKLFSRAERSLILTTDKIKSILSNLPEGQDEQSSRMRHDQLMVVKLLVAYCKRKGGLLFNGKRDSVFDGQRLRLIANEIAADLRTIGVECAIIVETDAALPAATLSVLYDCLHDLGMAAFLCEKPLLALYVHDRDPRSVEMSAVLQADGKDIAFTECLEALQSSLEQQDVIFRLTTSEDQVHLTVVASRQEKQWNP